mmetsp:Transcript_20160/g.43793  ORF Transcript_20160/g.43793 Transcript_20160/m.43793 type:complete len:1384 (-) Transcript_20160:144-4295(-)
MFTDELAGNPAKKRAHEAKARRLRAKREKEAKELRKRKELERREQEAAPATAVIANGESSAGDIVPSSSSVSVGAGANTADAKTATPTAAAAPPPEALTAAQKAAEQRKLRAEARARLSAATSIQSMIRSKMVAATAREDQRSIFDKRMSDLIALAGILKQSTKAEYVPPPATVSIMTTQFLFFACPTTIRKHHPSGELTLNSGSMVMEERDLSRWTKLVKNLLLPGVFSDNLDLDPLLPWMETTGGTARLQKVLNLCVSSVSAKQAQSKKKKAKGQSPTKSLTSDSTYSCYSAVDSFLRTILRLNTSKEMGSSVQYHGGSSRDIVYQKSRSILIQPSTPKTTSQKDQNNEPCSCDLITSLRSVLLYGSTRKNPPIPGDAGRLRENCVTNDEKERASLLLRLVVDLIASLETHGADQMTLNCLCSRFISEVMTVPLLTWKVSPSSYERLVHNPSKQGAKKVPPLVVYIHRFINLNADEVSDGRVESALNMSDVSLTSCPAPAVLCLLASLIQIGRTCEALHGMNPTVLHYKAAAEYFNFLATLINSAPLGTFSSRMSAVEWVSIGSSSTPIVLSDVVIEQASAILSDSYVRALFTCAINDEELDTKKVINTKTDKDRKHEKDLEEIGTSSASTVAAKEAMVDRNRSFWQSSKWAKKLTSLISGSGEKMMPSKPSSSSKGVGKLMNTSSISRQLANGKGPINRTVTNAVLSSESTSDTKLKDSNPKRPHHEYSVLFLLALCRAYGTIISRWGGNGKEDLVKRAHQSLDNAKSGKEYASANVEPCVTALLNVLCFSTSFVMSSWSIIQSNPRVVSDLYAVIDVNKRAAPIRTLRTHPAYKRLQHSNYGAGDGNAGAVVLLMFVTCMSHTLIVTDDVEIHDMEKPIPKHQLRRCILLLKKLLYRACCIDDVHEATKSRRVMDSSHFGLALISTSSKAMNDLYNRSSRRFLCVPKFWIEEGLLEQDLRRCKTHYDYTLLLSTPVCRICPFLISFKRRLKLFERIITTNRIDIQGSNEQRNLKPGIMVKVMRGRVLEDGLAHLNKLGRDMRQRIVVSYLSEAGARETGIDVGGLFKEFWSDLSSLAFDPNYVLFKNTEGSLMYPNPSSKLAHGSDHIVLFEFLGRILGKAMYEGITIQPQFAHLFLSFLRGDHTYLHLLTDLSTIDSQLYDNLMFLKNYDGDVSDLCLTFTVANDDFGISEVPLIANGANIDVTNANKRRYIYLVAKHHVSDRIKEQSDAFTRGLWDVIDRSWLRLFNEPELQVLISGASDGKIDVSDMKSNTRYVGGYTMLDINIKRFWSVVSSFSPKHQADLLRFVTSCERPPPLGFASMNPPFTIQRVGIMRDGDKLPSAATCFNTLKLPTYSSETVLRKKLSFAITAGAGFELT